MWKLALSQVRLHPRRYVAVLLAITLGTMFLAGSLLVSSSAKETTKQMLGATYANADVLITADPAAYAEMDAEFYELAGTLDSPGTLESLAGVAEVYPLYQVSAGLVLPDDATQRGTLEAKTDYLLTTNRPDDASLLAAPMTQGSLPDTPTEIALDRNAAERHELTVGETVTLADFFDESETSLTVSGIFDASSDPTTMGTMQAYLTAETLAAFAPEDPFYSMATVRVEGDVEPVLAKIQAALSGIEATANTPDVQISEQLVDMLGFDAITLVLGGFAAIALLVMMLVINNTFSVLVAQRTRQYALQRVLGATRSQIRTSVLAETVLIGVIGSLLGIGIAMTISFGLILLAQNWVTGATFAVDASIGWVLLAGVLATLIAAWVPAAKAMKVSPLQAMRPVGAVTVDSRTGTFRLVSGLLAFIGGSAGMVYCSIKGLIEFAVLFGMVSFIGFLMLGVLFVPRAVHALGWVIRPTGVPGKMAQLNAVRNPSRTAATATALMIGTTLVALILTGGRTVQENTDQLLATNYPVDIYAQLPDVDPSDPTQLTETTQAIAATAGITAATSLVPVGTTGEHSAEDVLAGSPQQLASISAGLDDEDAAALQQPGTVLVSSGYTSQTLTVTTADGDVELDAVRSDVPSLTPLVSDETGQLLDGDSTAPAVVWIKVDNQHMTADELQELITSVASNAQVSAGDFDSPMMLRSVFQQVINTVMLTVIGLLGISVLIAFVGVANTLALSALERTRENALMRALGLTKRGLRAMLSWEAALICAVGAVIGSALGMLYGWSGAVAIFAPILASQGAGQAVAVAWPWRAVGGIIVTAVLAGLIASVAPSRRAANMSPVEGLATD